MKYIEILKSAYTKGHPVPKCRTEERTFNSIKSVANIQKTDSFIINTIASRSVCLLISSGQTLPDFSSSHSVAKFCCALSTLSLFYLTIKFSAQFIS